MGTSDDEIDESQLLDELANEAIQDILVRTRVNVRSANLTLTDGVAEYDVAYKMLRVNQLRRGETTLLEQPRDNLLTDGFAFVGYNRILLGQAGTAGEVLFAWYTPDPTPMTDDQHDPSDMEYGGIPTQFHRAIFDYMCWHMADKAGDQGSSRGERYRVLYEGQDGLGSQGSDLGRIKTHVNARGSVVAIKRRRETLVGDREPNYWLG